MAPVKAVFFDLDDTLVATSAHDRRAFAAVVAQKLAPAAGNDAGKADAALQGFKKRFGSTPWDTTYATPVTAWRANLWAQAAAEAGVAPAGPAADALGAECQALFDGNRLGDFPWIDGVPALVAELKAKGYRLVIITNGHHQVQRDKLAACKAEELFQHIILGGEEVLEGRPEKPAESIFQKACGLAGVEPGEAIHVGDSLGTDVQGALNAKLRAGVWVNVKGVPSAPADGPQPHFTISVVTELPGVLAKLEAEP